MEDLCVGRNCSSTDTRTKDKSGDEYKDDAPSHLNTSVTGDDDTMTSLPRQRQILYTVFVYLAFVTFSFARTQHGSALIDLQLITRSSLDTISFIYTLFGVGGILGSLVSGWMFDRGDPLTILSVTLASLVVTTIGLPWCRWISLMFLACAVQSFFCNNIAIGCVFLMFKIWQKGAAPWVLALYTTYSFGGFLVPLLNEPFLSTRIPACNSSMDESFSNGNLSDWAYRHHASESLIVPVGGGSVCTNESGLMAASLQQTARGDTRVHYAYLIVGIYNGTIALCFIALRLCFSSPQLLSRKKGNRLEEQRKNPRVYKYMVYVCIALIMTGVGGNEMAFSSFLYAFGVQYMNLDKQQGTLLVALFFATFTLGRVISIFLVKWMKVAPIIGLHLALGAISTLVLCFIPKTPCVLWICVAFNGYGCSCLSGMMLVWGETYLPMTGRFTSIFSVSYTTGMMIFTPLTGVLFETVTPMWLPYMNMTLFLLCLSVYAMLCGIRRVASRYEANMDVIQVAKNDSGPVHGPLIKQKSCPNA